MSYHSVTEFYERSVIDLVLEYWPGYTRAAQVEWKFEVKLQRNISSLN